MLKEDPTKDGGAKEGTRAPAEDPQRGKQGKGTEATGKGGDHTRMDVDGPDQHIGPWAEASAQEQPRGLPSLRSRAPVNFVKTMAYISLLARAMGGILP